MAEYFQVHPVNPQQRALVRTAEALRDGAVIAYPTDSGFALGTRLGNQEGVQRIQRIRDLDDKHNHTLVVSEFAQVGKYVEMSNPVFRAVKAATPGRYTFILKASKDVPRLVQNHKRKTIGIRVPDHVTTLALLDELGEPLVSSTLILPGETEALSSGEEISERLGNDVDIILDSGDVIPDPTTVIDFTVDDAPLIVRLGSGDPSLFE